MKLSSEAGKIGKHMTGGAAMNATFPRRPAKQRVLIVTDAWAPQVNGVVRSYEHITGELRQMGHEVAVISPADFTTVPLPGYREIPLAVFPYRALRRKIAAFAPNVIHIAVEGPLGWAARRYCLREGLPFTTAFHTNFPAYIALRVPKLVRAPVLSVVLAMLRRFHGAARHTFVATPSVEGALRGWGFTGRLLRLSRGVDAAQFYPAQERAPSDRKVLLYVGRIATEKNLEAFLRLTEADTGPARKVVVGDGPALAGLRRAYPEVTFHGTLSGRTLADTYRAADVFVFPSRTDTFGIVLIEALASGLPVAAHDVPGPRDIITDPSLGALDDDLGAAIRRALAAPGSPETRSAHARANYTWRAVARSFLDQTAPVPSSVGAERRRTLIQRA